MNFTLPPKIVPTGNKAECHNYIRFAAKQLDLLERQMSFQGISKGSRSVSPLEGVSVECVSRPLYREIRIHVEPGVVPRDKPSEEKQPRKKVRKWITHDCICTPHFAIALVTNVTPKPGDAGYDDFLVDGRFSYDLAVCNKEAYLLFEGAYDANAGLYNEGDMVVVGIFDEMAEWDNPLDCQRLCLIDSPPFTELCIYPLSIIDGMLMWRQTEHMEVVDDV